MTERRRGNVPPHSREAEQSVLGAMLLSASATNTVMTMLDPGDFYEPIHGLIFEASQRLYDNARALDVLTLAEELKRTDDLEKIGGHEQLADLSQQVPNLTHVEQYAELVLEHSIRRKLSEAGAKVSALAIDLDLPTDRACDQAERVVLAANQAVVAAGGGLQPVKDLMDSTFARLEAQSEGAGLSTGLIDLDKKLYGLKPGTFVVVAGRPSMGKSAFALTMASSVAQGGNVVAIFSLEMSKEEIMTRLLSMVGEIDSNQFRFNPTSNQELWDRLLDAGNKINDWQLFIDDSAEPTATEIRAKCRRLKYDHGGLDLVIVDYLQLMPSTGRSFRTMENRQQEIADISREFKALSRELSVPVIGVSQLNRAVEQRGNKRPMLSDLRESGAIEQDADVVLFLYRDEYYDEDTKHANLAEVIIGKNRSGPTGKVTVFFAKEYTLFRNYQRFP